MRSYIYVALYGVDQRCYSCTSLDKAVKRADLPSICKYERMTSAEGMFFKTATEKSNDKFIFYYKISDEVRINGYKGGADIFSVSDDSDNSDIDFFKDHWAADFCMIPEWFKNLDEVEKVDSVILKNLPYFQSWSKDAINNKARAAALNNFEYGRTVIAVIVDKLMGRQKNGGNDSPICLKLTDENCEDKIQVLQKAIVMALKCLPCAIANKISFAINSRNDIENIDIFCTANADDSKNNDCVDLCADWANEPIKNPYAQYIRDFHDDPLSGLEDVEDIATLNDSVSPKVLTARCDEVLEQIDNETALSSLKSCIDLDKYSDEKTSIKLVKIAFSVCCNYRLYHNYYNSYGDFFDKWMYSNNNCAYSWLKELPALQVENIDKSLAVENDVSIRDDTVEFVNYLYKYATDDKIGFYEYAQKSLLNFFYENLTMRSVALGDIFKQFLDGFKDEGLAEFISKQESLFKEEFIKNYLSNRFKDEDLEYKFDFYKKCKIKNINVSVSFANIFFSILSSNQIEDIETLSNINDYFESTFNNVPKKINELLCQWIKQSINEGNCRPEDILAVANKIGYKISDEEKEVLVSKRRLELENLKDEELLKLFNGNNDPVCNDDMLVDYVCERFKSTNLNDRLKWFKKCEPNENITAKLAEKFFNYEGDFNNQDIELLSDIFNHCKSISAALSDSAYKSLSVSLHHFIVGSGKSDKGISYKSINDVAASIGYDIHYSDEISAMGKIKQYEYEREQKKLSEEVKASLDNHGKLFISRLPEQAENQAVRKRLKERKHGETGSVPNSNIKKVVLCDVLSLIVGLVAICFIMFKLEPYLKQHFLIGNIDSLLNILNIVFFVGYVAVCLATVILQHSKFGQFKKGKSVCAKEINCITVAVVLLSICVNLLVILFVFSFIEL